jgi:thiamine-phosphate pyrophosphorylase
MKGRDDRSRTPCPQEGAAAPASRPAGGAGRRLAGGGLYLILTAPAIPHEELMASAIDRRVPIVQLREKELPEAALMNLARRLADLTKGSDTVFIVNDRPDVAAAVGADGVHLGRSDARPRDARRLLEPGRIVGVSGSTAGEAIAARAAGADYIGVGPIYATTTKPDARAPVGTDRIRVVAAAVPELPIVAVGGIDVGSATSVIEAGADYVAVVSAICHAPDPVAALDTFLEVLGRQQAGASEWKTAT